MIEGARRWQFDSGVVLTPTVELGLRYDDGDAETGGGLEVGAGLRLENAARGLSAELTGRSLLAHQASELSEWGVGGSLRFEPGGGDRGLSIGLRSTLGAASSGITRLWEQQNAAPSAYRPAPGSGSGSSSPWKLKPLAWSGVTRRRPFSGRRSWRTFAGRRRSPEHLGEDYGTGGRGLGRFRSCSALDRLSALSGSRFRPSSDPWSHPHPPIEPPHLGCHDTRISLRPVAVPEYEFRIREKRLARRQAPCSIRTRRQDLARRTHSVASGGASSWPRIW